MIEVFLFFVGYGLAGAACLCTVSMVAAATMGVLSYRRGNTLLAVPLGLIALLATLFAIRYGIQAADILRIRPPPPTTTTVSPRR